MPDKATQNARRLRASMTDAERKLWLALRDRRLSNLKFRRQKPIGGFVADFACADAMLIVEADGGQHYVDPARDEQRSAKLAALGWRVIRFSNLDILQNLEGVLQKILEEAAS